MELIKSILAAVFGPRKAEILIPEDSKVEAVDLDIFEDMSKEELDSLAEELVKASDVIGLPMDSKDDFSDDFEIQSFVDYRNKIVETRDRLIGDEVGRKEVDSFSPDIFNQAVSESANRATIQMPFEIEIDGIEDPFADDDDGWDFSDPTDLKPEPGSDAVIHDDLELEFSKSKLDDFSDVEKVMVDDKNKVLTAPKSSVGDYLNSLVEKPALRPDGVERDKEALKAEFNYPGETGKLDPVHKNLFWTMATEAPYLWSSTTDLGYQETQALRLFLFRLAKTVEHRGLLLNADSFQRMAEHLKPGKVSAMLSEPWLSYRKLKASHAILLTRQLCDQLLDNIGFERLAIAGLPPTFAKNEETLIAKIFGADIHSLKTLSNTLRFMNDPMANTFASSFDYVAACLGDREAMVRLSEAIQAYIEGPSAEWLLGYLTGDLIITADNWKRLAYSRLKDRSDGIAVFAQMFSDVSFDLRNLASEASRLFGDSLEYDLPSKQAKEAMEILSSYNRSVTSGVQADWNNDFKRGYDKMEPIAPITPSVRRSEPPSVAMVEKAGKSKHVVVLDRITNSNSEIDDAFGILRKPLVVVESYGPDEIFNELNKQFPWMDELNEYLARSVAMAERREQGFFFKPILLLGPAGVGKSRWARKVSEITSVPMHNANLSGVSSSKSIVGSERGWSNARPCLPGLAFAAAGVANPIVYVDEVDKSSVGSGGDAVAGLLPMLEMETAKKYPDPFLLGNLDLSRISWIFTANKISGLHQEFLDRVKVMNVGRPTHKDHAVIVENLIEEATLQFGFEEEGFWEGVDATREKALNALGSGQSLRSVKSMLEDEVAKLVWKRPSHLKVVK